MQLTYLRYLSIILSDQIWFDWSCFLLPKLIVVPITSVICLVVIHTTYVTVHAKTSLVRTKIEIHFFTPSYSYIH